MKVSENKLQWIAIAITATGLIITSYYNMKTLGQARLDSELTTYLQLNDRYNKLIFKLVCNDSEVFKHTDTEALKKNKYIIYEMFDLFSTIKSLETYYSELNKDVWPIWEKRIEFFFSKPAVRYAWQVRMQYANAIYTNDFVEYIDELLSTESSQNSR